MLTGAKRGKQLLLEPFLAMLADKPLAQQTSQRERNHNEDDDRIEQHNEGHFQ